MKTCIDNLIHPSQTAYLPGKFMGTNVKQVQDIISDIHKGQSRKVVFFLDFHKAFDSVSHYFLTCLLVRIGFPESFIKWILLLY